MGPEDLAKILKNLPSQQREEILVGLETPDDAAVYQLDEHTALVHTVDFFTPIVDDPYTFGQIAATNALSDIYAMGGRPLTAMNILCYPCKLGTEVAVEILKGGNDKVKEAGAMVVGGHTVEDEEPKFGLAVTGIVDPGLILIAGGARPGDVLLLTKPLGTGVMATALKAEFIGEDEMAETIRGMTTLNRVASELALELKASACTDVTGFGLLGHLLNMVSHHLTCILRVSDIPFYPGVREMASQGMLPAGARNNRLYYEKNVIYPDDLDALTIDLLWDPQTSGGLLIALPPESEERALKFLKAKNPCGGYLIGYFTERRSAPIEISI